MKRILIWILASASAIGASAQTPVSLDSCRNMALGNNKAIRIAEENVKSAGYLKDAAKAAYLPGIDFTGGYVYNQRQIALLGEDAKLPTMSFDPKTMGFNYNILTGPDGKPVLNPSTGQPIPSEVAVIPKEAMTYDTRNVFFGSFTLTQPIFLGGSIRALNQIAKHGESMARSIQEQARQDVIMSVDEAYWQVVSLAEKKDLAQSFVNLVDSLRSNVGAMLEEGVATRSDVLNVEVKYNEACIMLTKVDNGLSLARMALAQICGLPVDTQMTLSDEAGCGLSPDMTIPDTNMQDVYARRADLSVIRKGIDLLKSKENLSLSSMLPKLAAFGAWSFSNPNVNNGFEKKFGGGFSVGAMLTVPIWHWGGNYNKYRASKSQTAAQRLLLEDMEEKVSLQVSQARYSFNEAFKTHTMTQNNMKSAEENLHNAEYAFKEGVLTTDDVLAAQTAWLKAKSELIDSQIGIRLCHTYLDKVTGQLGADY
ncbi:MAG: TolC family protein [Muribaculaceae bacterium]|nr:TolC family protein [Muribaculaceae bacterium]